MTTATMTESTNQVADLTTIGGRYKWSLGADGKYALLDVEMFSTHAKGENGVNFEVSDECLDQFYANMVAEFPKHALPVNIYHHDDKNYERPIRIGYVQPVGIKPIFVNDQVRRTIMVNVIGLSKNYFHETLEVEFPYRSAEIGSFKGRQFLALSLLKDEIGYFKYALLVPGEQVGNSGASLCPTKPTSPLMAYRASGADNDKILFLYKFGGNVDSKKKEENPKEKNSGDGPPGNEKAVAEGKGAAAGANSGASFGAGDQGGDQGAQQAGAQAGIMSILAKIWKCVQHLEKTPSGEEMNGDKSPSQDKKQEDPNKKDSSSSNDSGSDEGGASSDKGKKQDSKYSASQEKEMDATKTEVKEDAKASADASAEKKAIAEDAKYAAQADRLDRLESKVTIKEREDKAVADLTDSGYRLSKKTREMVAKYAAKGEESLKDFIADYKVIAEKDPSPDANDPGVVVKVDADASLPEEVASYKAKDPKEFAIRKSLVTDFASYQRTGGTMTFDRFVEGEKARVARGGR